MSTLSLSSPPLPSSTLQSGPASPEDQAASLRAAALRTLKAKRRKGTENSELPAITTLPLRPLAATPSIQLDYGSEESPATTTTATISAPTSAPALAPTPSALAAAPSPEPQAPAPIPVSDPAPMDVDEDQSREEGEISDSESAPPTAPKSPAVSTQAPSSNLNSKQSPKHPVSSPQVPPPSRPSVSIKMEPTLIAEPSPSSSVPSGLSSALPSSVDSEMYSIDEGHVRPGLAMTQAQYDAAKDIILDLLGWGVPPDYLLQVGLSREIVYYVFVELNLQLPPALDVSGLPPISSWLGHMHSSPEPMSPVSQRTSKPRTVQGGRRSITSSWTHPSLPRKPDAPQGTHPNGSPITSLERVPVGTIPESPSSGMPEGNQVRQPGPSSATLDPVFVSTDAEHASQPLSLHDIEQQRRQELLARKAVLASRKKQQAATTSSTVQLPTPLPRKVSVPPPIAKETVDDFLNSIGPVSTEVNTTADSGLGDDMDVDEQIPGLSASHNLLEPAVQPPSQASASPSESISPSSVMFPPPSDSTASSHSTRSSSTEVDRAGFVPSGRASSSDSSESSTPRLHSHGPRRVTKRPVAADFVDMEPGPSKPHHGHHHPYHRRKPFAGLTGSRRMIIDLSDSEEEIEDTVDLRAGPVKQLSRPFSRASEPSTPNGAATPDILLEKEQAIKMLREKIAQRERDLQGRMAAMSSRATPSNASVSSPLQPSITIKQEEDEAKTAASLSSPPPAPEPNGPTFASLPPSETTSGLMTPTDVVSNALEHPTTGDKVLTSEAWQEPVARMPSPVYQAAESTSPPSLTMEVDAADSSKGTSSAQVMAHPDQAGFAPYQPLLKDYPLLCSHSPRWFTDTPEVTGMALSAESLPSSSDTSVLSPVNLSLLKAAAVNRSLSDPSRWLCQYEIPGGGECRDSGCEDIHPSRAWAVEPSDEETAQHLHAALPDGSQVTLSQIHSALQDHRREPGTDYHTRVKEALASLGLRMAEG